VRFGKLKMHYQGTAGGLPKFEMYNVMRDPREDIGNKLGILAAERTTGRRILTCQSGNANDECNGSNRLDQHNDFSPPTPPSTTPSTSNVILFSEEHCANFAAKHRACGRP